MIPVLAIDPASGSTEKTCTYCGAVLARRANEYPGRWRERSTCGRQCSSRLNAKAANASWRKTNMATFFEDLVLNGECMEWPHSKNNGGYGRAWLNGKTIGAHRLAFILAHGPIPKGLLVCHRCDNPPCCNPDHLFVGTPQDNNDDMIRKGRDNRKMPAGHNVGSRNPAAKLSKRDVEIIRGDRRGSVELAKIYGVHRNTIYNVRSGANWND